MKPHRPSASSVSSCSLAAAALALTAFIGTAHAGGGSDPEVTLTYPNGGEVFEGGLIQAVVWTAVDETAVTGIDLYYRESSSDPWTIVALGLPNTGQYYWYVHNTPGTDVGFRVVAHDPYGNTGEDVCDAPFTITAQTGSIVPTTLRDFKQPGSQPFDHGFFHDESNCASCHSGYDEAAPGTGGFGAMMAHAMRDPVFHAALAIAEQDAASSGDLCLRCHSPQGWLEGRSNPTDGLEIQGTDFQSVSCHFCHLLVDPIHDPGDDPAVDVGVLSALDDVPTVYGNGMYVVDPQDRRRGPYDDSFPPHQRLDSSFHRRSDLCGTCHDVSNPAFERVSGDEYAPGPLDAPATNFSPGHLMPVERTYSEWLASDFTSGVYAPEFAGAKPDGIVSTCQDCHMPDAVAKGCGMESAPVRDDLGTHDLTGGNTWVPQLIAALYPDDVVPEYLENAALRAEAMLQKAAVLGVMVEAEADSFRAEVTVTNRTGHKLPTGYPEGRRMWLQVTAYDAGMTKLYESGAYDPSTGVLTDDPALTVYEAKMGISERLAASIGLPAGPSFHFVLNDSIYKDNRIPPMGFTNAAFDDFGARPVDPDQPGIRYPDGQNWDVADYGLPPGTQTVVTTLYYQTISKEYVEFLRDENTSNDAGDILFDLWTDYDRAPPVVMARDTTEVGVLAIEPGSGTAPAVALAVSANPFRGSLGLRLDLAGAHDVALEVYDVQGRAVARIPYGRLGGGAHRLAWDGADLTGRDVGAGVFFARVRVDGDAHVTRVVRVR